MGEVVYKDGSSIVVSERGQNDECITCLRELLDKAENGEVTGVAVAVQYTDRSVGETIGGFIYNRPLAGALMALVMRLIG